MEHRGLGRKGYCAFRGSLLLDRWSRDRAMVSPTERSPCSEPDCGKPSTWPKGCASQHYAAQWRRDHPENALTLQRAILLRPAQFPHDPRWLDSRTAAACNFYSCPRCSLPLADRSRFRCVFSVPLDEGGSASVDNLILICRSCSMAPVGRLQTKDDDPFSDGSPIRQTADAIGAEFETDVAAAWNLGAVSIRH